jgi:hypothetical protein
VFFSGSIFFRTVGSVRFGSVRQAGSERTTEPNQGLVDDSFLRSFNDCMAGCRVTRKICMALENGDIDFACSATGGVFGQATIKVKVNKGTYKVERINPATEAA